MRAPALTRKRARTLRREMTLPEVLLWQDLRRRGLEHLRFRRQHPIGCYILDFYAAALKLAVEIDGAAHSVAERAKHDTRRDQWLSGRGIRVLRFTATDILNTARRHDALATIAAAAAPYTASGGPPPLLRG